MLHLSRKFPLGPYTGYRAIDGTNELRAALLFTSRTLSDDSESKEPKKKIPPQISKLAKLMANMKIDKDTETGFQARSQDQDPDRIAIRGRTRTGIMPEMSGIRRPGPEGVTKPVFAKKSRYEPLYGGYPPLGIFTRDDTEAEKQQTTDPALVMWQRLQRDSLDEMLHQTPRNGFEQAIQWTEQGKLWHFPIDNEQGIPDEVKNVPFYEHVMLEHHLDDGFPPDGPIRKFMELVCIGLGNNPYISVERKLASIDWYRKYFKSKEEILQAIGMDMKTGLLPINQE